MTFRRPLTPTERACPPIKRAYDEFERAMQSGDENKINKAWAHVTEVREAYAIGQAEADTV